VQNQTNSAVHFFTIQHVHSNFTFWHICSLLSLCVYENSYS